METCPTLKCAFKGWKYKESFDPVDEKGNNIKVQCKLCLPTINILSTSKSSTSNLKKHLMRKHLYANEMKEDTEESNLVSVCKQEPTNSDYSPPPLKKPSLQVESEYGISQSTVDQLLYEFMIESAQSLDLVDNPSFINLIQTISVGKSVLCRQDLIFKIENEYTYMRTKLDLMFQNIETICATIDMWSAFNKNYLCLTCHWIDEETLRRKSAALSLKIVNVPINHQNISSIINEILDTNKIKSKLSAVVTENNSHLVKVFPEFEKDYSDNNSSSNKVQFLDVGAILNSKEQDGSQFNLPIPQKCAYHTLNMIATDVVNKAALKEPSHSLYKSAMGKCASIWHKKQESATVLKALQDIGTMKMYVPSCDIWISQYTLIAKLMELEKEQLNEVCNYFEVPRLQDSEFTFLREYISALQPLAQSIEVLRGDKRCYYGYLIPTILSLKTKLSDKLPHLLHCAHVLTAVNEALDNHFEEIIKSHSAKMATVTLPKFRLCWPSSDEKVILRRLINLEASMLMTNKSQFSSSLCNSEDDDDSDEDFFVFGKDTDTNKGTATSEVTRFLDDSVKNIDYLHTVPIVKELFIKYNTTVPYCSFNEQLLSNGGNIFCPLLNKMSDEQMERCFLLRYNKNLFVR
ncbi:uncharacterized protein [Lepeophtheirus salmonis]|uniref:uncharacterized protein n=1 Tax=Lepeophtheirus salmonis TaxID=72036 RepID=UPI001AE26EC2|nr:uncharacterized protein LOC121118283 [Lepeophtheirus salmonis]